MEIIYIIIFILTIAVIYLIYKTRNVAERFDVSTDIKQAINDTYKIDLDAMRNLGQISQQILTHNDTLTLPATNLVINGNVKFTNKDTLIMEIFPKYMVLAWANNTIPLGWALCDGNMYILDNTGKSIIGINGTTTPDLRGRFILGAGIGTNLIERKLNDIGGEETHKLTTNEIPSHSHFGFSDDTAPITAVNINDSNSPARITEHSDNSHNYTLKTTNTAPTVGKTSLTGNSEAHNNMPPFYVLTYIMKL